VGFVGEFIVTVRVRVIKSDKKQVVILINGGSAVRGVFSLPESLKNFDQKTSIT
jgi:hypothetical protein